MGKWSFRKSNQRFEYDDDVRFCAVCQTYSTPHSTNKERCSRCYTMTQPVWKDDRGQEYWTVLDRAHSPHPTSSAAKFIRARADLFTMVADLEHALYGLYTMVVDASKNYWPLYYEAARHIRYPFGAAQSTRVSYDEFVYHADRAQSMARYYHDAIKMHIEIDKHPRLAEQLQAVLDTVEMDERECLTQRFCCWRPGTWVTRIRRYLEAPSVRTLLDIGQPLNTDDGI